MKTTNVMGEKAEEHVDVGTDVCEPVKKKLKQGIVLEDVDVGTDACEPVKKKLKQARLSFEVLCPTNKKKRKLTEEAEKRSGNEVILIDDDSKDRDGIELVGKKPKISDEISTPQQIDNENVKNKSESDKTDVPNCENECNIKVENKEEKENKPINEHSDGDKKTQTSTISGKTDGSGEQDKMNCVNEGKTIISDVNKQPVDLTSSPEKSDRAQVTVVGVENTLKTPENKKALSTKTPESKKASSAKKTPESKKASSAKTPTTSATKERKLTPKQLKRQQELEKKREEKLQQKQEKEQLRESKKQERIRLKIEKEDLKRREKEEKEKKRLAELEQKNEEKRIKEEERRAKEEERKAKEEEKRKKEEEKMAVKLKEEKTAAAFASFFVPKRVETKSGVPEVTEESEPVAEKFMPFEVKVDMRLAPISRVTLSEESKFKLDKFVNSQHEEANSDCLYLHTLKSTYYIPGSSSKTWPITNDDVDEDDILIIESEKVEGDEHVKTEEKEEEKKNGKHVKHMRAKLLQFEENRRPPYWGTWRKKSQHVRPRAPFSQDKAMFEYDVDSDDEWEEVEDGESLRGSDDEESQDENYEEDNVMFVPHGYLSDEEGQDELEDTSPEAQKLKLKYLQMEFEAERNEKQERIKPRLIGCVWFKNSDSDSEKVGSHIAELLLSRRVVFDGELPVTLCADTCPPSPETSSPSQESLPSGSKKRLVPEAAIPMVIKLLHGNTYKRKFITNELYTQFTKQGLKPLPSLTCVADKIREIAEWTICPASEGPPLAGKKCWYVKEDVRKQYALADLNVNQCSEWNYICEVPKRSPAITREQPSPQTPSHTRITKFTKVLSAEERKRQLLVNASDDAVTPEKTINQKRCESLSPSLLTPATSSKTVTPVAKQKKRAVLITVGPVQGTSKQAKNNSTLQNFIKSPKMAGSDKNSETSNKDKHRNTKDSSKCKSKANVSSGKTTDDECIVLSD